MDRPIATPPAATWRRFSDSLRHRQDWRSHRLRKALRYTLMSLLAPRGHARWLALLDASPAMRLAVARDMRLLERWQHRTVNLRYWAYRRLALLNGHYSLLPRLLPADQLLQLYTDGQITVATAAMKDGQPLQLKLSLPVLKSHEGELNLSLCTPDAVPLYAMTVTFDPARSALLIGCLQGPAVADGLQLISAITRQSHGLRPKNLLLSAAYALARSAGLQRVLGISNQQHAWRRHDRVRACYDSFWLECGGQLGKDGFFDLGEEPLRDIQDVASKHRSAFRQREALRLSLTSQLMQYLQPIGSPPPAAQPTATIHCKPAALVLGSG